MKCYRDVNEILPETNKGQQIKLLGAKMEIDSVFLTRHFSVYVFRLCILCIHLIIFT